VDRQIKNSASFAGEKRLIENGLMENEVTCSTLTREILQEHLQACIELLAEFPKEYWQEEHFLKELPGKWELSVFASQGQRPCGYIIASRKNRNAHIHKFIVAPAFRAQGVGSAMLDLCLSKARSLDLIAITLWVYADNTNAIRFYQRQGFGMAAERILDKDRLYLMIRELVH
jgi:ribosomal protein S18 acetylase RimI-like enzyme